jgi:hypothetical protein
MRRSGHHRDLRENKREKATVRFVSFLTRFVLGAERVKVGRHNRTPRKSSSESAEVDDAANGGGKDRIRMKIWERDSGFVVYDSLRGAPDDIDAVTLQEIGGSDITVHVR